MSRIRSIHPGLWTDELFVALSPMARLFFMGIWNECDDQGSFEWSPLKLKMRLLPADNVDAAALLDEIVSGGNVLRYEIGGKAYGAVRNFCQYQRPKKANSTYPQTTEVTDWVNTAARSTRDGSEPVGNELPTGGEKSRQRKEEGDNKKIKPPTSSPDAARDWSKMNDLLSITNELCDIAGVPRPTEQAKAAIQMDTVKAWLADGIDPELDIVPAINAAVVKNEGGTYSLKRFDATVRHHHRRRVAIANDPSLAPPTPAGPALPLVFDREGEPEGAPAFRSALASAVGEATYRAWLDKSVIGINDDVLVLTFATSFLADYSAREFNPSVEPLAATHLGCRMTSYSVSRDA